MWVPLYVRRPSDFANLGTLIAQETGASGALLPASRARSGVHGWSAAGYNVPGWGRAVLAIGCTPLLARC